MVNQKNEDDFPINGTGTNTLQKYYARAIRMIIKKRLLQIYKQLNKKEYKEGFRLKEELSPSLLVFISQLFYFMKLDIANITNLYTTASQQKAINNVSKSLGIGLILNYDKNTLLNLQKESQFYFNKYIDNQFKEVEEIISYANSKNKSKKELADEIKDQFANLSYKSEQLARTEMMKNYNNTTYHLIENSGKTKWYRWKTSRDEIVCIHCRPLHNRIFSIYDTQAPKAPLHPFCRCHIEPYFEIE